MSKETAATVEHQVRRARRRLFLRALADALLYAWAGGFAAVGLWWLLQAVTWPEAPPSVRWGVAGGLLAAATAIALARSVWRRPSSVEAALELDSRFGLKERATTWLALSPDQADKPAGQALAADATARVARLRVADKFPLHPSWSAALLPALGAAVAVACFFLGPTLRSLVPDSPDLKKLVQAPEVQQPLEDLKKAVFRPRDHQQASKEQKELDESLQKLLQKPLPENQEQVRERVQEMKRLEEKMQDRINSLQEQANKMDRLKAQLQKLQSADAKKAKSQDGPAKELEDALAKGEMDKALDALDKLQKKLKNDQLNPKELQELAQQFNDLHEKLQRLMNMGDLEQKLQREVDLGNLTPEQMKDLLAREMENMQDLEELAELLKQLKDRLPKDGAGALEKLAKLRGKLQKMKLTDEELDDLERNGQCLCEAREALLLALQQMNGMSGGGPPGGKRPVGKEPDSRVKNERQRAKLDPTGALTIPHGSGPASFKKVPAQEVGGVVRQSAQDAYQALDRQRIPPDYADSTRGYFQNLTRPKE